MAPDDPHDAAREAVRAAVREGRYVVNLRTLAEALLRTAAGASGTGSAAEGAPGAGTGGGSRAAEAPPGAGTNGGSRAAEAAPGAGDGSAPDEETA